jgi:hypothetical protein
MNYTRLLAGRTLLWTALMMISALTLFSSENLGACEFTYILEGPGHEETRLIPGIPVSISSDSHYSLSISYREDHRNCLVPPEDTLFLVEEERWRTGKDYLALELLDDIEWEVSGRALSAQLSFQANRIGTWPLQVIRECTRGGYDQALLFTVN